MNSHHLSNLVRDTRPNSHIWSKLDAIYWSAKLGQLRHHTYELGQNEANISFRASFRVEGSRIRAMLTPHSSGHSYTHLTVWRWYELKPKLIGVDEVNLENVA